MRRKRDAHGKLYVEYHEVNERHFGGLLPTIPITFGNLSEFGHMWADDYLGAPRYIMMQERHVCHDPWPKVRDTLLHEMVHVWQAHQGRRTGHGLDFRAKAKVLGCEGKATC